MREGARESRAIPIRCLGWLSCLVVLGVLPLRGATSRSPTLGESPQGLAWLIGRTGPDQSRWAPPFELPVLNGKSHDCPGRLRSDSTRVSFPETWPDQ